MPPGPSGNEPKPTGNQFFSPKCDEEHNYTITNFPPLLANNFSLTPSQHRRRPTLGGNYRRKSDQIPVRRYEKAEGGRIIIKYAIPSQESRVKCQESRVKSQESRVKSQESRVKSQESRVKSQESRVKSQESRVKSLESRVKSQESRVKSQESRVKSQESRVKSQESRVKSQELRVESSLPKSNPFPSKLPPRMTEKESVVDWPERRNHAIISFTIRVGFSKKTVWSEVLFPRLCNPILRLRPRKANILFRFYVSECVGGNQFDLGWVGFVLATDYVPDRQTHPRAETGGTTEQQNNRTTEQQNNRTTEQQNKRTKEQQNNRTAEHQNNRSKEFKLSKNLKC
ncbi:conserved hypothetical protein [Culex quinquefasciatus]|uniref:Av71 muscle cell intermediate filament n=1 Tax=Culex quinquefasciatus TaxID=7176 RepID=B0WV48_CULQU|nr:conserved hypothetical protein [Culex quinquefasciatus]|eukprot:XP_001861008.1 conserved hypothetical protein [Culex quinquefasciatus]